MLTFNPRFLVVLQRVDQMWSMFNQYVKTRTQDNFKFWIVSLCCSSSNFRPSSCFCLFVCFVFSFPKLQYVVLGPRLKVINLNILPESSRNELKYSLKIAFMFFSIILKFQVPDINILLGIRKKATVFDGPWSANVVLGPRLR